MVDYYRLPKMTVEQIDVLKELYGQLNPPEVVSFRRRRGVNTNRNLSVYSTAKWFNWTVEQRARFRNQFPDERFINKAVIGYFINFPKHTGFLDRMETWKGEPNSGTMIAYALHNNQHIYLNDVKVKLMAGDGIVFNLSVDHEVKKSKGDSLWANTMVLGAPELFVD